jgi:hypothetical protein
VLARHPRHNFDSRVLSPGLVSDDAPFTFDETSRVAYQVLADVDREEEPDLELVSSEPGDQPPVSLPTVDVRGIEQILDVLKDPIAYYYEEILNVDIPELPGESGFDNRDNTIKGDGVLALTLDALGRSSEGRRLLQIIAGYDGDRRGDWLDAVIRDWTNIRPKTRLLPPDALGALLLKDISQEIKEIIESLPEHLRNLQGQDVDCRVPFGESVATLRVPGVVTADDRHEFVRVKYTRFSDVMDLQLWAEVVFLTIHQKGEEVIGYLATRNEDSDKKVPSTRTIALRGETPAARIEFAEIARRAIEVLVGAATRGPVDFFPSASHELSLGKQNKAAERLTKDASRSSAIDWYLDGRSMYDLKKEKADPALFQAIRANDEKSELSAVELVGDYIWKAFVATTVQSDNDVDAETASGGSDND